MAPPVQKPKVMAKSKQRKAHGAKSGSAEHLDYYLDWDCNTAGAIAVTNGHMSFPTDRSCKVLWVRLTVLATSGIVIRGFQLFNSAGVVATSCAPKIFNTQRQTSCKLVMPISEDYTSLPAQFRLVVPTPAVGGFRAVVHARVAFKPQIVFPSLAFAGKFDGSAPADEEFEKLCI
jgi:hypothetical protein